MIKTDANSGKVLKVKNTSKNTFDTDRKFIESASDIINRNLSNPESKIACNELGNTDIIRKYIEEVEKIQNIKSLASNETIFNNTVYKLNYWITNDLKRIIERHSGNRINCRLAVIADRVSKHEMIIYYILSRLGAEIQIFVNDFNGLENIDFVKSSEDIMLIGYTDKIDTKLLTEKNEFKINTDATVETFEQAIDCFLSKEYGAFSINGVDVNDTSDSIIENKISNCIYCKDNFSNPTPEEIAKIQHLNSKDFNYVVNTLSIFIVCNKDGIAKNIRDAFIKFAYEKCNNVNASIAYNKLVKYVITLNKILIEDKNTIVFEVNEYNELTKGIIDILKYSKKYKVLLLFRKKITYEYLEELGSTNIITLNNSREASGDTNKSYTMAYNAQEIMNRTIFNGEALGLYRNGQFRNVSCSRFVSTFAEIEQWIHQPLYLRPGYNAKDNNVVVPTMFNMIKGYGNDLEQYKRVINALISCTKNEQASNVVSNLVYFDNDIKEYPDIIRRASSDSTMVFINHLCDYKSSFKNQTKKIYNNGKLNRDLLKLVKNYKYSFLDIGIQEIILDKIEQLINMQEDKSESTVDMILNVTLNISDYIMNMLQISDFSYNSFSVCVVILEHTLLNTPFLLKLVFLNLLGFDINIVIPTGYNVGLDEKIEKLGINCIMLGNMQFNESKEYYLSKLGLEEFIEYSSKMSMYRVTNIKNQKESKSSKGFFRNLFGI